MKDQKSFSWEYLILVVLFVIDMAVCLCLIGEEMYNGSPYTLSVFFAIFLIYPFIHGIVPYILTRQILKPHLVYLIAVVLSTLITLMFPSTNNYLWQIIAFLGGASIIISLKSGNIC